MGVCDGMGWGGGEGRGVMGGGGWVVRGEW